MNMDRVFIVGGNAAGMSVAAKLRREDPSREIIVFEEGKYISYGACGLPYYIAGLIPEHEQLLARNPRDFEAQRIDVRLRQRVEKVIPAENNLVVRNLETQELYITHYDQLVLAAGAKAVLPHIPGTALDGVFTLKSMEDGINIKAFITKEEPQEVCIVGAGYIGMELAEAMIQLGKKVRIIERQERILNGFEKEISQMIKEHLEEKGIAIHTEEEVEEILGTEAVRGIKTDQNTYQTDMVVFAVGVRPNTKIIEGSKIKTLENGAIIVDNQMRTNIKNIFAAGDCAVVYHKILDMPTYIPLATNANKQGRTLGAVLAGEKAAMPSVLGSTAVKILEYEVAKTGITQEEAERCNIPYESKWIKTVNHPPYFPNSKKLYIKIIYNPNTGQILGAQIIGKEGAVQRVNVFAAAIDNKMTTEAISTLDLCYAPPFAPVWDGINVAGSVAAK